MAWCAPEVLECMLTCRLDHAVGCRLVVLLCYCVRRFTCLLRMICTAGVDVVLPLGCPLDAVLLGLSYFSSALGSSSLAFGC